MLDIESLKKAAQAATPGKWKQGFSDNSGPDFIVSNDRSLAKTNWGCSCCQGEITDQQIKDAAFIAAANPSVVLELIERIEKAEADLDFAKRCLEPVPLSVKE